MNVHQYPPHELAKQESLEQKKRRMQRILRKLKKAYPDAKIALRYSNPLELLIATILSAQCTDERVNQVTATLFQKYRTAQDYAAADIAELEQIIYPTGYYRAKARNIQQCCQQLVAHHNGEVPLSMDALVKLPGVGRKTANVVLGEYGKPEGIVVDTHVARIVQRLGFVATKNREKIERELMQIVPKKDWVIFTHLLIAHGRTVCTARKPRCEECVLLSDCPSAPLFLPQLHTTETAKVVVEGLRGEEFLPQLHTTETAKPSKRKQ